MPEGRVSGRPTEADDPESPAHRAGSPCWLDGVVSRASASRQYRSPAKSDCGPIYNTKENGARAERGTANRDPGVNSRSASRSAQPLAIPRSSESRRSRWLEDGSSNRPKTLKKCRADLSVISAC